MIEDGRMTEVTPVKTDPKPSALIKSMPDALYADCRVKQPAIRKSWLEQGPGAATERRGADPFIPVSWDRAEDLVINEFVYDSFVWVVLGCFGIAGIEKFSKK